MKKAHECRSCLLYIPNVKVKKPERPLGQRKTPPANKLFLYIQIKVIINCWQVYGYHTDLVPLKNLYEHDLDLSSSLKVKCQGVIGLAIYGFLLMVNSNIWPNLAPLRDIRL